MCGIFGYIGTQEAQPILLEGLRRLEYRGYDSAGIATISNTLISNAKINYIKSVGKVTDLEQKTKDANLSGTVGIGHTRWATHGEPSECNAHPQLSGWIAVVHNGIIENHEELRKELQQQGFQFESETDTECLAHLIAREFHHRDTVNLETAVSRALVHVEGAYAIAVIDARFPDHLVAACNSSPLVIGLGENELFVASDELAFAGAARAVAHLKDDQIAVLKRNGVYSFNTRLLEPVEHIWEKPSVSLEQVSKGGHEHFMLKEILEQPTALKQSLAGRIRPDGQVVFGGLGGEIGPWLRDARRINLVGCGTSRFAAMVGKLMIEKHVRIPVDAAQASEFRYGNPILSIRDVVIGISQSGTTADTLLAVEYARDQHALVLGITNRVGSTLAKRVRAGMYLHAGPEIAVASTKAFTCQVSVLALLTAYIAPNSTRRLIEALREAPALVEQVLRQAASIKHIAEVHADKERWIVIGRGFGVPLALEAALKLKEIAYVDAHGDSAAELKHGQLALVENGTPVIAIVPPGELGVKMLSNLSEVETRGGHVIALVAEDGPATPMARYRIELPAVIEELVPVVYAPALQLLAYYLAVMRGNNPDQPRNLAKSVTVE